MLMSSMSKKNFFDKWKSNKTTVLLNCSRHIAVPATGFPDVSIRQKNFLRLKHETCAYPWTKYPRCIAEYTKHVN